MGEHVVSEDARRNGTSPFEHQLTECMRVSKIPNYDARNE